jgi:hypothetical protein
MRYLVVVQRNVTVGEVFGPDEDADPMCTFPEGESKVHHQEVSQVVLCKDTRAVHAVVRKGQPRFDKDWAERDWAVFEVMPDGRTERRALIFKMDGPISYDVEVV